MTLRHEALAELLTPEHSELVLGLLLANRDVRIAVPTTVLSKGASGAGARVQVNVVRRAGTGHSLSLDCGRWWRGAPTTPVHMDYRQLLQHANDDALRTLHNKLTIITKSRCSRAGSRTQVGAGRALFDEAGGGKDGSGKDGSSKLRRTSSTGLPPSGLQRTSSTGLPPSGPSALRRTSSTGIPAGRHRSDNGAVGSGKARSVHISRLSAPALHRAGSLASSLASSPAESDEDEVFTPEKLAQVAAEAAAAAAAEACSAHGSPTNACTPAAAIKHGLPPATRLSFEDSAGPRLASGTGRMSAGSSPVSIGGASWQQASPPAGLAADPSISTSASALSSPLSSPTQSSTISPASASCTTSPSPGCESQGLAGSGCSSKLSRQPTFSEPYYAEFEDEEAAAAGSRRGSGAATPPRAAPAGLSAEHSGSMRAAQLLAAEDQMTADELHEVAASFNHVFVPPWAVPAAPPQQAVVRTYCEAGVQTSTGAAGGAVPLRHTHTAEDAVDHFEAFMQHFDASLPHLAMALADIHLGRGGDDPTFVKSQFYFNQMLLLRDEMRQLGERLACKDSPA